MSSRYKGTPWRETRLLRSDLKSKGIIYFLSAFQLITLNYGNCNPEINTTQLPLRHLRADQCYLYGGILQGYICGPETNQMESYGYGIAADGRRLFFNTVIMSVIIFPIVRLMQAQEWQRHFSGLLWRQRDN